MQMAAPAPCREVLASWMASRAGAALGPADGKGGGGVLEEGEGVWEA
jgi:hypothetical protein